MTQRNLLTIQKENRKRLSENEFMVAGWGPGNGMVREFGMVM